ncbi:putative 3-keto sterol reductase [Lyophyllum shimeji]|uniref:3-keto sterol reductase n=1 Tax=Lyophyllum shimeji TaxID=47721 RepID=A0A9P3PCR9_LYOSH|nr:putative 3-keto sterol reductase [Lyophyllum shimeji]
MAKPARPIVIVTGANGGIGFGICQRLLFQFCHTNPPDALPQSFVLDDRTSDPPVEPDGLTLIMACRSVKRAEVARTKLLNLLDTYIAKLQRRPEYDGHAHAFRKNVTIDIVSLDLAMISSVFKFADEVSAKYPYISRLICNAGVASFSSIDWPACFKQMLRDPMAAVTGPQFYLQHEGEISIDGLGWVWQCNLFGHYVLYRSIHHLLLASPTSLGSRVVWMSSLEASPIFYDSDDWQLKKTEHSYESTKYQIDLICTHLDRLALQEPGPRRIRHFVTEPGVCSTNVANALVGPVLDFCKVILFYFARWFGSPHHTIDPFKAAIGAVHLSLASLAFITLFETKAQKEANITRPVKFCAQTDRWGHEHVGIMDVKDWEAHKGEAEALVGKLESLFQTFKDAEQVTMNFETASEHM